MGIRLGIAEAVSATLTWGLRHIAHRPAANTPGLVALKIDPHVISELRGRAREGFIVVVGTNGKTTVTNLLANVIEQSGRSVLCNRTGANLNTGIASALLQSKGADWGVLECDELWSAKVVPQLRPKYFVLLDLFRDQLDRCGEIEHIQDAIVSGLIASPETVLIYNADDPLCEMVAQRVQTERGSAGPTAIAFGTAQDMGLKQNRVADATMCQRCSHMFDYDFRQYGQLGAYVCLNCGFTRPSLDYSASNITFSAEDLSFDVFEESDAETFRMHTKLNGTYMVYNLLAICATARTVGCPVDAIQRSVEEFDPKNGRLQEYIIRGHRTLLNLAKNPTGFNQNLRIVSADKAPRAVAFFINDKVVDGHDISWIWDIDFEELAEDVNVRVFAGGIRKNDLQVRLKYAGVSAELIDGIEDVFAAGLPEGMPVYAIANYTALPPVHAALDAMAAQEVACASSAADKAAEMAVVSCAKKAESSEIDETSEMSADAASSGEPRLPKIVIAHILPDLLNLYGDGGNVRILEQRLAWRGIPVEVRRFDYGDAIELDDVDLVVLGGSPDREQRLALQQLQPYCDELAQYVEDNGPLLAICGGYQMLGRVWVLDGEEVPGLDVLPIDTRRPGASTDRLIDNVAIETPLSRMPVIGYENHSGRTYLDADVQPFGKVVSHTGKGNNDTDSQGADGVVYKNLIGTYLHGPLLSKNPEIADWLLTRAAERASLRAGQTLPSGFTLAPLDDFEERAANDFMARKLI